MSEQTNNLPWWKRIGKAAYDAVLKELWEMLIGNKTKAGASGYMLNEATIGNKYIMYATVALTVVGAVHAVYRSYQAKKAGVKSW